MLIGMIFLRVYNVGRTDTCTDMAESLRCLPETVTTLLIDYTQYKIKSLNLKTNKQKRICYIGNSQQLRFYAFTSKDLGSIPGWATETPQAVMCGQNKKNMLYSEKGLKWVN